MRDSLLIFTLLTVGLVDTAAADLESALRAHKAKDYASAFTQFKELAEQGDAAAQSNIGYYYDSGITVKKDPAEALKWYRAAAEQGDVDAQYNVASMYEAGEGASQDYGQAFKWYRKAAAQGDVHSRISVGLFFEEGLGVSKDDEEAYAWFSVAASSHGDITAIQKRDELEQRLTPEQTKRAKKRAGELILEMLKEQPTPPEATGI